MTFLKIIRHNIKLFFLSLLLNLAVLQGQTPINTIVLADFPFNGLISGENPVYCQAFNAELDILALSVKNRIIIWNGHSIKEFICKGNAFLEINKSGEVYFLTKSEFGVIRDSKKANSSIFKFSEGVHENEFENIKSYSRISPG